MLQAPQKAPLPVQNISAAAKMPALVSYGIAFSPRSGSTWLTDVIEQSRLLGKPGEYFNTDIAGKMIARSKSSNFEEYLSYLKQDYHSNNVFGFEISWPWMHRIIEDGNHASFESLKQWFFLRRQDFVLQAVSLDKAIASGVFHVRDVQMSRAEYHFDPSSIARQALQVMYNEFFFSRYFRERGIDPRPLWYEEITSEDPAALVKSLALTLNVPISSQQEARLQQIKPALKKMGNQQNLEIAQRFREEHSDFVDFWEKNRGEVPVARFKKTFESSLKL